MAPSGIGLVYAPLLAAKPLHVLNQSLGKVLTLTGRFSFIRSEIAFSDEFIERVEKDSIDDWLYGRIEFKTGDDKSTWFTLLKNGWEMLYLPDTYIYCLENAGEKPFRKAWARCDAGLATCCETMAEPWPSDGTRSASCLVLTPRSAHLHVDEPRAAHRRTHPDLYRVAICCRLYFALWVLYTRLIYLCALVVEGHRMSNWDLPLLLYQQWVGSFIKIQTFSDLRRQKWGAARGDARNMQDRFGAIQTTLWFGIFGLIVALLVLS